MADLPSVAQRQAVEARAGGYCEYCLSPVKYAVQSFECEHILPIREGGKTTLNNLAFACGGCNRCKAARTVAPDPENGQLVPLYNPRQQKWHDHFVWNQDFTLVIGLTAIGRSTVEALRINRPGVVNLRRVLLIAGEHPPVTGIV
jgi:hypothetical protein